MGKKQIRRRKHFYFFLACVLIIPILLSGCAHFYEELVTRSDFQQAGDLTRQGNYKDSLNKYEQIIGRHPSVGDGVLFKMGLIFASAKYQQKDYQKSLECLQQVIKNYPESSYRQDSDVLISLIEELVIKADFQQAGDSTKQGNYKESLSKYEQIMSRHPSIGDVALFKMGLIYASAKYQQKDYQKSMECFQRVIKYYPESSYRQDSDVLIFLINEISNRDKRVVNQRRQILKLEQQTDKLEQQVIKLEQKVEEF
jgi:outer membrane protein assembly factor BamD (BamD/ComL family)